MTRKKALIIVDVQQGFISNENKWVLSNIQKILQEEQYDAYIEAIFYAPEDSLWNKQMEWTFAKEDTVSDIKNLIPRDTYLFTEKTTKSAFKGTADVTVFLKEHDIEEVHVVGLDTNDCILATAYESFDLGFWTYVIEQCTASSQSTELREAALQILREQDMLK